MLTLLAILAIIATDRAESSGKSTSGKPTVDLRSHPLGGNAPVSIALGLYVAELGPVNEADEDFEIQGYLYASWHDDRLVAKETGHPRQERQLDPAAVWNRHWT